MLRARARLLALLRQFFDSRDFVEVETPLLSRDVVVDRHLDPFFVKLYSDPAAPDSGPSYFTQTSPEFAMKRLLAAGELPAIYQICKAFRAGEKGDLHNPEFTMLEWYRVGDDYERGMNLLAELAAHVWSSWTEKPTSVERTTYGRLFQSATGLNPHTAPTEDLIAWSLRQSIAPPALNSIDRDSWLDWISSQFAETRLDANAPTIVYDFPASKAALAQVSEENGAPVARRFELYCGGLELANGYHELLDAEILVNRAKLANQERVRDGKRALPDSSRLVEAMRAGLPPCAGTALGVDRLLMALVGAKNIAEVVAFPVDRA
jgi:elongation factor P--(R)-beta-lysine ligase